MQQDHSLATQTWNPKSYLTFERNRIRPALDLLGQVTTLPGESTSRPIQIVDVGAGTGNMVPAFLNRWPDAQVELVDSSKHMLTQAKQNHQVHDEVDTSRCKYTQQDFESYSPSEPLDLIFSNAALQWVDGDRQDQLIRRLYSFLQPGGTLAIQIPDLRAMPLYRLMRKAAEKLGFTNRIENVRDVSVEQDPPHFYELLRQMDADAEIDMWVSTYCHVMHGDNPVGDFISSTGLGPYLEQLGGRDSEDSKTYERVYRDMLLEAYPKQSDGSTIFNMTRFFLVAKKPKL